MTASLPVLDTRDFRDEKVGEDRPSVPTVKHPGEAPAEVVHELPEASMACVGAPEAQPGAAGEQLGLDRYRVHDPVEEPQLLEESLSRVPARETRYEPISAA